MSRRTTVRSISSHRTHELDRDRLGFIRSFFLPKFHPYGSFSAARGRFLDAQINVATDVFDTAPANVEKNVSTFSPRATPSLHVSKTSPPSVGRKTRHGALDRDNVSGPSRA